MSSYDFKSNLTPEELSAQGKKKYAEADLQSKLSILESMKRLDKDCNAFKGFRDILSKGEPLIFCHIGTTGLEKGNETKKADQITQIALVYAEYNDAIGEYEMFDALNRCVEADAEVVERAINDGKYDIFAEGGFGISVEKGGTGITKEDYINHVGTVSVEELKTELTAFFAEHSDAKVVKFNTPFDDFFINKQGLPNKSAIDLRVVVPEYDYDCLTNGGRVINENEKNYGMANLAENIGVNNKELLSAYSKCHFLLSLTNEIGAREGVLERDNIINEKAIKYRDETLAELGGQYGDVTQIPQEELAKIGVQRLSIENGRVVPVCEQASDELIKDLARKYDEKIASGMKNTFPVENLESAEKSNPEPVAEPVAEKPVTGNKPWRMEYARPINQMFDKVEVKESKHISPEGFYHTDSKEATVTPVSAESTATPTVAPVEPTRSELVGIINGISAVVLELSKQMQALAQYVEKMEQREQNLTSDKEVKTEETKTVNKTTETEKVALSTPTVEATPTQSSNRYDEIMKYMSSGSTVTAKTVDKTEQARANSPAKANPVSVIADDLKGHEYETELEDEEMPFKGTTV